MSDTGQSPVAVLLTLTAKLEVTFRAAPHGTQAEVTLRDVQLLDHAQRPAEGTASLLRELAKPFGFELTTAGQLAAYYEEIERSPYASGYRRQIASLFQFAPLGATEAREWDPTGLARIQYGRSADGGQSWKKLSYERVLLAQSRQDDAIDASKVKPEVVSSEGTQRFDSQGLLELQRHEQLRAALTTDKSITTSVKVSLRRLGASAASAPPNPELFVMGRRTPVDEPIDSKRRVNFDEVMIGQHTPAEVLAQYAKWAKAPTGIDSVPAAERATFFRALVGLLRTKPETLDLVRKAIDSGSPARDPLVDALGAASTAECSLVLSDLVFAPKSSMPLKVRAATALIREPEPNEAALSTLERMLADETFREHGVLGLGTFARLFRQQGNEALANRATSRIQQELEGAQTAAAQAQVLLAIANSGATALYERAIAAQGSKASEVRHAAIQALRLMDDPRVEPRLVELLGAEDEGDVQSALQALGRRETSTETLVKRVEEIASTHAAAMVRREAVLVLIKWREKWPRVEPVLVRCAEKDADKRVREAAGSRAKP